MSQIKFTALSYTYPNTTQPALLDVNLDIEAGAFTLVIGESGSGKSTLLRCLNGLVPHFTGGHIAGMLVVDDLAPVREGPSRMALSVGMVFQDPESQFVLDRVEDEIAFALENAAMPRDEMHRRVDEALQQMEIERLRERKISSLSGGEQQRVAIAAALVLRPRILVLDEPTSQLDPESAEDVMDALSRLNRERGLTIVLAEHRIERILPWVHQIVLVEQGRVVAGAPAEVLMRTALTPPLVTLGKRLGVTPLSLDVADASERFPARLPAGRNRVTRQPAQGAPAEVRLCVKGVCAGYGQREVLSGVSIDMNAGEIVALMGRNGAGKSTLLKSIIGIVKPTAGEIRINDVAIIGRDTWDICRDVAYLPQNPNTLLFADTVDGELQATLANHGLAHNRETDSLLDQLGLRRYAQAYPRDLSVGERERVAIGAVTVTLPKLMLLDEPTRGLDYSAKRSLADLLRRWKTDGAGVLLVTHDVEFVAECAGRVIMLADGKCVADGAPAQVLTQYPIFTPQIAQIFPNRGWLTVEDVL